MKCVKVSNDDCASRELAAWLAAGKYASPVRHATAATAAGNF